MWVFVTHTAKKKLNTFYNTCNTYYKWKEVFHLVKTNVKKYCFFIDPKPVEVCQWTGRGCCQGVILINILSETFSYESALLSFSLITVWLCHFLGERISAQKLLLNVDEIDYRTRNLIFHSEQGWRSTNGTTTTTKPTAVIKIIKIFISCVSKIVAFIVKNIDIIFLHVSLVNSILHM